MNEPAVFDVAGGTMPLDVRHDNEGAPTDHREIHNVYGMLMSALDVRGSAETSSERASRSFCHARRSPAVSATRRSGPATTPATGRISVRASRRCWAWASPDFPFVGSDIGGFADAPTRGAVSRAGCRPACSIRSCARTRCSARRIRSRGRTGRAHEAINRRAIELRYELLPYLYNVMHDAAESGVPAMRPLMLEYPNDEGSVRHGRRVPVRLGSPDRSCAHGSSDATRRLPARRRVVRLLDRDALRRREVINVPVTISSIPIFVRGGGFVFEQPVVQHTGEMPGHRLDRERVPGRRIRTLAVRG